MIRFLKYSKEEKKIKYYNSTSKKIPVKIDFFEGHTNSFMFTSSIDLEAVPDIHYFTYIPARWKNMRAYFYHRETNELLAPFVFDGDIDMKELDYENYLTKIQSLNSLGQQAGVNDVLREHFSDRHYENIVDVEEGDVVVDIGFNYGIFSLGALKKGASKIYGFEPNKNIYEKLKYYPRKDIVQIFNLAVSDKYETLTFYEGDNTLGSSVLNNVGDFKESYEVDCINFYDFIVRNKITKIDFLKVDCEGTEYKIFESIPDEFFQTIKKIHVEFHNNFNQEVQLLIDKLEKNGFEWQYEFGKDITSNIGLIFAKKRNKNLVLLSSFCDTPEKVKVLEKNIKKLKENFFDVAIISPIELPKQITEISDFIFITKENPVLDWPVHAMFHWKDYYINSELYRISNTYGDYGWAGLLHVKRMAEIFINYDYDFFSYIIYDTILEDKFLEVMKKGHRGLVFPSKRNNVIWQVGLHLMIFNKEILKKIIPKINLNDYLSYKNFDAFAFLHNHIVIPLELEIAKEPVEDEIYYYEDYDFFNMSDDKDMKYMISSPDEYIDTLKIFFYSVSENLKIKVIVNQNENDYIINNFSIIDLGVLKTEIENVILLYNEKSFNITKKIQSIKNSAIRKLNL
jgi:FkbM family methyltransferase